MKRYQIKYMNRLSQVERHVTYCLGDADLNATLVDLVNDGNFIDWIGSKDEHDNIARFYEIDFKEKYDIFEQLGIKDKNEANEQAAWREWEGF